MTSWREVPPVSGADAREGRSSVVRGLIPFAIAAVLALIGLRLVAIAVAVAGVLVLVLTIAWPAAGARLEGALAAVGRFVGRALSLLLLGLVELVVFLPLSVLARLFRRDPLVAGGRPGPGWTPRSGVPDPVEWALRPFGTEDGGVRRPRPILRAAYLGVRVIGWVVIVVGLNYALGWLWDEWFGTHDTPAASSAPSDLITALSSSEAAEAAAWSDDYWSEFRALEYEFHPFILSRVATTDGRYIDVDGAERRSYRAEDGGDAPEVWFLGGAAMWGQGQRDLQTIPSQVARLAEQAGTPIQAVNLGQPGYTSWQAALLLEQQLAVRPPPDLVVFYDGAADMAVQLEQATEVPSHYNLRGVTEALTGRDSARDQAEDWWEEYRETSVLSRLVEGGQDLFGVQPAAASGLGLGDRVADLHERSVDLAASVAARHDVETLFTWQAAEGVAGDGGAYRRLAGDGDRGPGVVDLSRALDDADRPVFLDGVLTNERGAEIAAASLWPLIAAELGE